MANSKVYDKSIVDDKKICGICRQSKELSAFWKEGHKRIDSGTQIECRRWFCAECGTKMKSGLISKEEVALKKSEFRIWLEKKDISKKTDEIDKSTMISALMELSRHDIQRLHAISKNEFVKKTNASSIISKFDFNELKELAEQQLYSLGLHRPINMTLGKGRYLVVGDSHGKHTPRIMFKLLRNLNKHLKFDKIIHIGHILDDDNIISYCWKDFDNLVVIAKTEEAMGIENAINNEGYDFAVVRQTVNFGKLQVANQDMIGDYVRPGIESMDNRIYNTSTILNSHKHEFDTRCAYNRKLCYATPGCLCKKHIVKTIRQIDFTSGYQVKIAYPSSFIKYRRMNQLLELWEQGMAIVEVDEKGDYTIVMCRIKPIGKEYATSYFDKIYCGNTVHEPDNKIFFNSDLHIPQHSTHFLEVQDKLIKDYKPDIYVNLGDIYSGESLNHHKMQKGEVIFSKYLDEISHINWILSKMSTWARKKYLLLGNHERFVEDFTKRFPQLKDMLMLPLLASIENCDYDVKFFKDVLNIGNLKCIHGDFKMYGQKGGNFLIKIANTFTSPVIVGHLHYTGIRAGCYMIGLSGDYNQQYNEVNATNWLMGVGICNQYKGESFLNTIPMINNKIRLNNKTYSPSETDFWKMPEAKIEMKFLYK